jgi:DNA/RNA-binding domain of Phe-tRNA-synthetase-like protein
VLSAGTLPLGRLVAANITATNERQYETEERTAVVSSSKSADASLAALHAAVTVQDWAAHVEHVAG